MQPVDAELFQIGPNL